MAFSPYDVKGLPAEGWVAELKGVCPGAPIGPGLNGCGDLIRVWARGSIPSNEVQGPGRNSTMKSFYSDPKYSRHQLPGSVA